MEGNEDEIIVGAKYGYAIMQRSTGKLEYIKKVWDERDGSGKANRYQYDLYAGYLLSNADPWPRMRMNDGAVDSHGRYWVGTMNDPKVQKISGEGVLFRLDPDMALHRMIEGVTIPNGIGWTADDKSMYFTDTTTGEWHMRSSLTCPTTGGLESHSHYLDKGPAEVEWLTVSLSLSQSQRSDCLTLCLWVVT